MRTWVWAWATPGTSETVGDRRIAAPAAEPASSPTTVAARMTNVKGVFIESSTLALKGQTAKGPIC